CAVRAYTERQCHPCCGIQTQSWACLVLEDFHPPRGAGEPLQLRGRIEPLKSHLNRQMCNSQPKKSMVNRVAGLCEQGPARKHAPAIVDFQTANSPGYPRRCRAEIPELCPNGFEHTKSC